MKFTLIVIVAALLLAPAVPLQETPPAMVATYDSLADAILAVKATEANLVRSLLDGHYHAARVYMERGEYERAAAEVALFANEGDNAFGGVRKRLLEGGHHHNADGEAKGIFEPGFVIVTREAKQRGLEIAATLRRSTDDDEREKAWDSFDEMATDLLR